MSAQHPVGDREWLRIRDGGGSEDENARHLGEPSLHQARRVVAEDDADLAIVRLLMQPGVDLPDLRAILHRPTWQYDAACRGVDPKIFFSGDGSALARARSICARCLVIEECEGFAKSHALLKGIWAGKSERARARERMERRWRRGGAS